MNYNYYLVIFLITTVVLNSMGFADCSSNLLDDVSVKEKSMVITGLSPAVGCVQVKLQGFTNVVFVSNNELPLVSVIVYG